MILFARARGRGRKGEGWKRQISGVGYVTHEPPLRMAERSPAAKQSIYAFKMAAKNATHPTPRLPLPRSTYTAFNPPPLPPPPRRRPGTLPLSHGPLTPVELSTSLSRMPPKLFNFGTQPLTANQPILPLSSARMFVLSLSLAHSWIYSPFRLSPSFLYLSLIFVYIFHFSRCSSSFFPSDICSIRLQLGRARSLPSKMTPSQIDKARKIYCRARSVATFAQVPCANRDKEQRRRPGRNPILEVANFDSLSSRSILNLEMTR